MRDIHHYLLYHQGNPLLKFATGPGIEGILPINVCGIFHINLTSMELVIQCPVEDVRIERDGEPVDLRVVRTTTMDDITSYMLQEPEQGA